MSNRPVFLHLLMAPTDSAYGALMLRKSAPDLIVLGEGILPEAAAAVAHRFPQAIVVAGEQGRGQGVRGVIRHEGKVQISYAKLSDDGHTAGLAAHLGRDQRVIYQAGPFAVAVLVCKDVGAEDFADGWIARLQTMDVPHRILAIPADMGNDFFFQDVLSERFAGLTVALCNARIAPGYLPSFITCHATRSKYPLMERADGLIEAVIPGA